MGDGEHPPDRRSDHSQFLAELAIFEGIQGTDLHDLCKAFDVVRLASGERLFAVDEDAHALSVVLGGSLRLVGAEIAPGTPVFLARGHAFATRGLPIYVPTALEAAEDSDVLTLPWAALSSLLETRPALRDRIVVETSSHLRRLQIASTPLFRALDDRWIARVAAGSQFVEATRGELILREGEAADCVFIVVRGSLEVFRERERGKSSVTDILGDGTSVGEMGVLRKEPRSVSVRARRDSTLIRIPAAIFDEVLSQNAQVTLQLASTLSDRLKRTTSSNHRAAPLTTIAVLRACDPALFAAFWQNLSLAFERSGHRIGHLVEPVAVGPGAPSAALDFDRLAAALAAAERTHDYVLCPCETPSANWTRWCLAQADLILVVGSLDAPAPDEGWSTALAKAREYGTRLELALLRANGTMPIGSAKWLDRAPFQTHHHVAGDSLPDYDRLVRRLSQRAWGLVLGGGGARGFAHIGVVRALREHDVPIDMIGGTSMGAILAAQYAMGCDDQQMLAMTRKAYVDRSWGSDLTMPFVSLRSGRGTMRRLKAMFQDRAIEDLPIPYFCVSCNLTRADAEIHDRGPVWLWVRVSCSVPGLLPPVPYRGDVLVDGGLLDNLPVNEMRRRLRGSVAAADVSVSVDLGVDAALESGSPWSGVSQLLRLVTDRPRLPNIVNVLMRTAEIGSVRDSKVSGSPADLYLHVPLEGIAMTDFQAIDRIVAAGYEYTARRLEEHRHLHPRDTR